MKTTGIVRGIDSLGRIVLPKELRTNMHIDKDSKLEIFVEGDQIILKKHRPAGSCDFCGVSWRPTWPSMRVTASAPPAGPRSLRCKPKRRIT